MGGEKAEFLFEIMRKPANMRARLALSGGYPLRDLK
jgi:hypothetical protein